MVGAPAVADVVTTSSTRPAASPGSSGVVSSRRSNTAMTAMTLANGSQLHVPIVPSTASATQVHQLLVVASWHNESAGVLVPPSAPAEVPIGRQASPLLIPETQPGVVDFTVVADGPA